MQLFCYVGYITPLNIKFVNLSIFNIYKGHYVSSVTLYSFGYIISISFKCLNFSIFRICEVYHSSTIILLCSSIIKFIINFVSNRLFQIPDSKYFLNEWAMTSREKISC
jgi:hypothetical protein